MKLFRNTLMILVVTAALAFGADEVHYKRLGEEFICTCSCNQLLTGCTHLGCPNSGPMRAELRQMIDAGRTDPEIHAAFKKKYGPIVLSAPSTSGFDLTAWLMPFVALAAGIIAVAYVVRSWRMNHTTPASGPLDVKYQSLVEEELKKYTPED